MREANQNTPGAPVAQRPERTLLQPRVPLDTLASPDDRPLGLPDESVPNPRDLLNRQELLRIVQDMINQLSEKQREVLVRRYGLGAGHEAETLMNIAQSIGISHQQVSMREKRALEKLGSILRPMFRRKCMKLRALAQLCLSPGWTPSLVRCQRYRCPTARVGLFGGGTFDPRPPRSPCGRACGIESTPARSFIFCPPLRRLRCAAKCLLPLRPTGSICFNLP